MAQLSELVRFDSSVAAPLVSREKFSQMCGLPLGVVVGFINKGYLPTVSIGKYSLINVAALQRSCFEKEFTL